MALLPILEFPDPRLRTRATPVKEVDASIQTLVDDMFETMYDAPGIGLAASQFSPCFCIVYSCAPNLLMALKCHKRIAYGWAFH